MFSYFVLVLISVQYKYFHNSFVPCRNVESIRYGLKSLKASKMMMKQYYYQWMLREDADACLLRLFECFMESAPQMTLQLYLLVDDPPDGIGWYFSIFTIFEKIKGRLNSKLLWWSCFWHVYLEIKPIKLVNGSKSFMPTFS